MNYDDWGAGASGAALPLFREFAVDWDAGTLALRDGEPYTVEGAEALQIWMRLALAAENRRFAYSAHSHDYGNELSGLLGQCRDEGIRNAELRRRITEALTVCPYILGAEDFTFRTEGSSVTAAFTVRTVYHSMNWEVAL